MKKWPIKYQLTLGFSILVVLLISMAVSSSFFINKVEMTLIDIQSKRIPSIDYLIQADRDLQQAEVALRGLFLVDKTSDQFKSLEKTYNENADQVIQRIGKFSNLKNTDEENKIINTFNTDFSSWKKISTSILKSLKNGKSKNILIKQLNTTEVEAFEKARNHLDKLQELQVEHAAEEKDASHTLVQLAYSLNLGLIILAFILGGGSIYFVMKFLSKSLNSFGTLLSETSNVLISKSNVLATNGRDLGSASTQQASSISETVASVEEINRMVQRNTENSERSSALSKEGAKISSEGSKQINEMISSMGMISESNGKILSQVEKSNTEISEIIDVINEIGAKAEVINDIVFQTKLLAFNASVEAARAGEHGKGFAVVAEEVGNLAQMSGKSASEIAELLEASTSKVNNIIEGNKKEISVLLDEAKKRVDDGETIAKTCGDLLIQINTKVENVSQNMNQITSASKEQLQGINEINTAMTQMDKVSQMTSSSAQETAQNATELEGQVSKLNDILNELEGLLGRKFNTNDNVVSLRPRQRSLEVETLKLAK